MIIKKTCTAYGTLNSENTTTVCLSLCIFKVFFTARTMLHWPRHVLLPCLFKAPFQRNASSTNILFKARKTEIDFGSIPMYLLHACQDATYCFWSRQVSMFLFALLECFFSAFSFISIRLRQAEDHSPLSFLCLPLYWPFPNQNIARTQKCLNVCPFCLH